MPRTTVGSLSRSLYNDVYRESTSYHKLQQTLRRLHGGEKLPLANGLTICRQSNEVWFNVINREDAVVVCGDIDTVLDYATSSGLIDSVTQKSRARRPQEVREDDVALARLLRDA